jgi:pimeloyl-ACP methyl ester carboxylesterase
VVRIDFSARAGHRLAADLTHADSGCGVIMVHDLMADRNRDALFPEAAKALRRRGWGSLRFDLSGCGESDDQRLTPDSGVADLQSAIDLMRSMGYRHLALWGHGLGSRFCLERARGMECLVLSDALLGRVTVDWGRHFSAAQLACLAENGYLTHRAASGIRREFVVDRSLVDYYGNFAPGRVLTKLRCPVLVLQPAQAERWDGLASDPGALMRLLPARSERHTVPRTAQSTCERVAETARIGSQWISAMSLTLPARAAMAA